METFKKRDRDTTKDEEKELRTAAQTLFQEDDERLQQADKENNMADMFLLL